MKRLAMVAIVGLMAIGLTPGSALGTTLNVSSPEYLGYINPSQPASETAEASYINTLLAQSLGSTTIVSSRTYVRSSNACADCPTVQATGTLRNATGSYTNIDVTGWTYLLAKYDGPNWGSEVWYVGGIDGMVSVPDKMSKYGISHYTLFNNVSDGGATLMLLGGALVGFEALRRRIRA